MRDDVIHHVHAGPQRPRGHRPAVEECWAVIPHREEVVLELERSSFNEGLVGTARRGCEAGFAAETDLAEEIARNPSTKPGIIRTNDGRRRTVPHHHEVHQLTHIFARALWVKVDGASLRADDSHRFDPGTDTRP